MKKNFKKIESEIHDTIINHETGEIIEERTIEKRAVEMEPDYVKLYVRDISCIMGLSPSNNDVLYSMLCRMDYENKIVLNSYIRKQMCEKMGIKENTLSHVLNRLIEKKILKKIANNTFEVNPWLFGRGKWEDIYKLRLVCCYDIEHGRTIKTERISNNLRGVDDDEKTLFHAINELKEVAEKFNNKRGLQFLN